MKTVDPSTFRAAYDYLKVKPSAWVNLADIKALCKRK